MATKFSIKLFLNKRTGKLLFAEAQKDFVDFLLTVLTLPLSAVAKLWTEDMTGCLGELFQSLPSINNGYFRTGISSDTILNVGLFASRPNSYLLLQPTPSSPATDTASGPSAPTPYCTCSSLHYCVSDDKTSICPHIHWKSPPSLFAASKGIAKFGAVDKFIPDCPSMSKPCQFVASKDIAENGYVNGLITYMVKDDLSVTPMASAAATIAVLSKMTMDLSALQEKVVDFGADEALKILKASLESKNVLTDVFLK